MDENDDTTTAIAVHRVRRAQAALAKSEKAASDAIAACNVLDRWGASFAMTVEMFAPVDHAAVDRAVLKEVLDDVRVTADLPEDVMMVVLNRRFQVTPIREWCERSRALGGPAITPGWLRDYVTTRLIYPTGQRIDSRVRRAAVLMDSEAFAKPVESST